MPNQSTIPITDMGFRYGYGVFETLVVKAGKAQFFDWHQENLREAATALKIPVPDLPSLKKTPNGDGIWRWIISPSGLYTWFEAGLKELPDSYRLGLSQIRLSSAAWDSRYKTLSYLQHYQAWLQRDGDESLLLNEHSEIASVAMANIFWLKDEILYTPSLTAGCRSGVIRRWISENFTGEVRQVKEQLPALINADELFITNSRIGIMPITELLIGEIRQLPVGRVTASLREQFRKSVA